MKQQTLAAAADQGAGFEQYRRPTRRDVFLATMQEIVPWQELCAVIAPHYPKPGNGRPPVGLQRMLRMYFVQHWFNLADEACEEALLDSTALRRFVGIDLGRERVPDGTTLLKFRRLLETHKLGEQLFAAVGQALQARGLKVGTGTIVDATIIGAPSSTKNADKARDPEMHQTRKGQQHWDGRPHPDRLRCAKVEALINHLTEGASTMKVTTAGIDLAKNVFQVHGVDEHGKTVLRKQLKREQMALFFANLPTCLIGMEACGSAHHWARKLQSLGQKVRLVAPQFVKPYVKTNKNDAADAEAIC